METVPKTVKPRPKNVKIFTDLPVVDNIRLKICDDCKKKNFKNRVYSNFDNNIYCPHEYLKNENSKLMKLEFD